MYSGFMEDIEQQLKYSLGLKF